MIAMLHYQTKLLRFVVFVMGLEAVAFMTLLGASPARAAVSQVPVPDAPRQFITQHSVKIGGHTIRYTAIAGETYLTDLTQKPIASIFSFSYLKHDARPASERPITFVFNGGPGSSSLWLHLGVLGPKRVVLDQEINPTTVPPFGLRDNPDSPLDMTDLVFIDPVGTGFSHALGDTLSDSFYGVDEDAAAVAQFIELWLTRHNRWNSPKYVIGESYGSVRAAVLPRALMAGPTYRGVLGGVTLNGIIMLGTSLEAHDGSPDDTVLSAALSVPGMADTAWYHSMIDRKGRSLEDFHAEALRFATDTYLPALSRAQAGLLPIADTAAIAARLHDYIGIPAAVLADSKLSISPDGFAKRLLVGQGLNIGMYDTRYTLQSSNDGKEPVDDDPSMAQYVPGFVAAFHQLLSEDLKVDMPVPYGAIIWKDLNSKWNWHRAGAAPGQNFATDIAVAMRRNPSLRLMVAAGYYDLVTPSATAEHLLREASVPQDRTRFRHYASGHMLYLGGTAAAFASDVREFVKPRP